MARYQVRLFTRFTSGPCQARWISSAAPPPRKPRQLNLMAPFARPPPRTPLKQIIGADASQVDTRSKDTSGSSVKRGIIFETSATTPVGTSLQEVPPDSAGSKVVSTAPAVKEGVSDRPDLDRRVKEMTVQGVVVPPKPVPPGEEECCMSGCVHCVYTIYADNLEVYVEALRDAREALIRSDTPKAEWPEEVREEDKGDVKQAEEKKVEREVDPAMAAFLALENKLKKKSVSA
ncbi:hypothetical protein IAU60_001809 [Kwoniella sp. DSM 27419]